MIYTYKYKSPLGHILLAADEVGITGLWFEGQKYFGNTLPDKHIPQETEILTEAKKWLDVYFSGEEPTDDHIRRTCPQNGRAEKCIPHVCPGSWRCGWTQ